MCVLVIRLLSGASTTKYYYVRVCMYGCVRGCMYVCVLCIMVEVRHQA